MVLATLPLGGSDTQRLGRANRLKRWRETCLSCPSPLVLLATLPEGGCLLFDAFRYQISPQENGLELNSQNRNAQLFRKNGF